MRYRVELEGFEGQIIELSPPNLLWSRGALYVNGVAVSKTLTGKMLLRRANGQEVTVEIRPSFFSDGVSLVVGGKEIEVVPSLAWYQYLLSSTALLWIVVPVIGPVIAIFLLLANILLLRSRLASRMKYGLVVALSMVFPILMTISLALGPG